MTGEARSRWKNALLWFLKSITAVDPRRIVLKSPPHTARIKVLMELFPNARFVHIVRDPFVLFPSTVTLWKRLYQDEGVQVARHVGLDDYVFRTLDRMYEALQRDRPPRSYPSRFSEVRYEDLVKDPVGQMRRIYRRVGTGRVRQGASGPGGIRQVSSRLREEPLRTHAGVARGIGRRWCGYISKYGYSSSSDSPTP